MALRMNTTMRQAFVKSVLNDLPEVDYEEQIRKLATTDLMAQIPAKIMDLWRDETIKPWINQAGVTVGSLPSSERIPHLHFSTTVSVFGIPAAGKHPDLTATVKKKVKHLALLWQKQEEERYNLKHKLESIVRGYPTVDGLAKALPEFAKYLPKKEMTDRSLPVIANVVAAFTKAGWPKDRKPPKRAADRVSA